MWEYDRNSCRVNESFTCISSSFPPHLTNLLHRLTAIHYSLLPFQAKLGAAVAVVQAGIEVIIAQCGSVSAEKFVKGEYESVYDVEEGTLLTTVARSKLKER